MSELVLQCLSVADVAAVEYHAPHTRFIDEIGDNRLKEAPRPVGMTDPPLGNHFTACILRQKVDDCVPPLLIRVMHGCHETGP